LHDNLKIITLRLTRLTRILMKKLSTLLMISIFIRANVKNTSTSREHIKFDPQTQEKLMDDFTEIHQQIKDQYQLNHIVSKNLHTIELIHLTALDLRQLIKTIEPQLKKKENAKKTKNISQAKTYIDAAIGEVKKAQKSIEKQLKQLNNDLKDLLGNADNPFNKAHLAQAQKDIDKASQELNTCLQDK